MNLTFCIQCGLNSAPCAPGITQYRCAVCSAQPVPLTSHPENIGRFPYPTAGQISSTWDLLFAPLRQLRNEFPGASLPQLLELLKLREDGYGDPACQREIMRLRFQNQDTWAEINRGLEDMAKDSQ